jgi:hypothetical protein
MAMLLLNNIFSRTWGHRAGEKPEADYWPEIIPAVRKRNADFKFIAEAYWDLEWELQQHGFDFCYDKKLYDRLEHESAESVRLHLLADMSYQERLVRFIENHDEPRAAATFSPEKVRAAAILAATLPGARLFHEGQFQGRKVRLPVFLGRRPKEQEDQGLIAFYRGLLAAVGNDVFRNGTWQLCERTGWPDNQTCTNLIACCWFKGDDRYLVVTNFSDIQSQGNVWLTWGALQDKMWRLTDVLTGSIYERRGDEMLRDGLYVDLQPWGTHLFRFKMM